MLLQLSVMSALLGASSFVFGIMPLSFTYSKSLLERLSALSTGLLLGAALGVIIPEGIETIVENRSNSDFPSSDIAMSLLFGFTLMLVIEQLVSPHSHSHSDPHHELPLHSIKGRQASGPSRIEFDADAEDHDEHEQSGSGLREVNVPELPIIQDSGRSRAFPLTFGLVIHGLADGLALGVSSLAKSEPGEANKLTLIVFVALIIHKAPTSLAYTTSLLATSLQKSECKKYLAVFASSTPLGAIVSYAIFSLSGEGDQGGWAGIALLVSGGTFLYVATVLQPVSHHTGSAAAGDLRPASRVILISLGMFLPFALSLLFGHGH